MLIVDSRGARFGRRVRLANDFGGAVAFSPDGKQLVFSSGDKIHVVSVDGKEGAQLIPGQTGKNHSPAWSPDGKYIVFINNRK